MNSAHQRTAVRLSLFLAGLVLLLGLIDDFSLFRRGAYLLQRRDVSFPLYRFLAYAGTYLLGVAGLVVVYCHASRTVRAAAYGLTGITLAVFVGAKSVNGYGFAFHEASLAVGEPDFLRAVLATYAGAYLLPSLGSICMVAAVAGLASWKMPRFRSLSWCLLPVIAALLLHQIVIRSNGRIYQSPVPYRVPILVAFALQNLTPYYGHRDEPYIAPSGEPLADHIVFIVDESIRGDLLGINGAEHDTTPFLDGIRGEIFNYGVIPSTANLSRQSNILLQSGLSPAQLPDPALRSLKSPNIFSYMQKAGFSSFFLDSQIYSDRPPNYMTSYDLDDLDGHIQIRRLEIGTPQYEMDYKMIDRIAEIISTNARSFSYALKIGAHFDYEEMYPQEHKPFAPTGSLGELNPGIDRVQNSYRNVLRWTVDGFFERLDAVFRQTGRNILVVYTADHGQALVTHIGPGGRESVQTHGTIVDPPSSEAAVPLFLLAFGDEVRRKLRSAYDPALLNRTSAFELFPTLLLAAGYEPEEIREHYYFSIFDRREDRHKRRFMSGDLFAVGDSFQLTDFIWEYPARPSLQRRSPAGSVGVHTDPVEIRDEPRP